MSPVGIISGAPQAEGTYGVEIQVASGDGQGPVSKVFEIVVTDPNDPLVIDTSSLPGGKELPDGTRGVSYETTLSAQGADGNYAWSLAPGSTLPPTLALGSDGVISGIPEAAGLYEFTVQVEASYGDPVTADLSIEVFDPALEILTTNEDLPAGQLVGLEYPSTPLEAGGGDGAKYTWEIVDPLAFPPGLVLDSGVISGVATTPGSFTFEVAVTSGEGDYAQRVSQSFTLKLEHPTLGIVTKALPGGFTGRAYEIALLAAGGDSNHSWTLTAGLLPPGLTFTDGVISGVPTTPGLYPLTLTVSSAGQVAVSHSQEASGGWSISIALGDPQTVADCEPGSFDNYYRFRTQAQCLRFLDTGGTMDSRRGEFPAVSITTESLPAGRKDNAYVATFAAEGGADNPDSFYRWFSDDLPGWLTLEADGGTILGTPRAGGSYTFTVTVKSDGRDDLSDSKSFTIEVSEFADPQTTKDCKKGGWREYGFRNQGQCIRFVRTGMDSRTGEFPLLSITTESLPDGEVDKRYRQTLRATGGSDHRGDKYTWSSLDLPDWLRLNPNAGRLHGRPSQPGTYTFTVTVTSADGQTDSKELSLLIEGDDEDDGCRALRISTRSLPDARKNKRYSKKLRARGCPRDYDGDLTWSSPDLPGWLSINSESGKLSGIPRRTESYTFTVMVADDCGNSATKTFTVTVKKR
jgi:hypothetical protein